MKHTLLLAAVPRAPLRRLPATYARPTGQPTKVDAATAIAAHPHQARDLRRHTGRLTDIRPPDATEYFQRDVTAKS